MSNNSPKLAKVREGHYMYGDWEITRTVVGNWHGPANWVAENLKTGAVVPNAKSDPAQTRREVVSLIHDQEATPSPHAPSRPTVTAKRRDNDC